jgi:hypothetical protein
MVSIFDTAATCWSQVCELLVASTRPDPPKDAMLGGYLISVSLVDDMLRRKVREQVQQKWRKHEIISP